MRSVEEVKLREHNMQEFFKRAKVKLKTRHDLEDWEIIKQLETQLMIEAEFVKRIILHSPFNRHSICEINYFKNVLAPLVDYDLHGKGSNEKVAILDAINNYVRGLE